MPSTSRPTRAPIWPDDRVVLESVHGGNLNGQTGTVVGRSEQQSDGMPVWIVRLDDGGTVTMYGASLRRVPGTEPGPLCSHGVSLDATTACPMPHTDESEGQ